MRVRAATEPFRTGPSGRSKRARDHRADTPVRELQGNYLQSICFAIVRYFSNQLLARLETSIRYKDSMLT